MIPGIPPMLIKFKRRIEMDSEERLLAYFAAERQQSSAQWTKGDLLLDLEGESLMEFSEQVNDSYQQLRNYKWVASCYPLSVRTDRLSWTHHERIAAREDRAEWLKKAADNRWSVKKMQQEIRLSDVAQGGYEGEVAQAAMVVTEIADSADYLVGLADEALANWGDAGLGRFLKEVRIEPEELAAYRRGDYFGEWRWEESVEEEAER
jgi:hypothetical protein